MRATALAAIESVRLAERAQVKTTALSDGDDRDVDFRRRVGVRQEEEAVTVVRRPALRVWGDVSCVRHGGELSGRCRKKEVRPKGR